MANPLAMTEEDMKLMLAADVYLGAKNLNVNMKRYVWRRRQDGVYIINLGKTWEKLMLAARIICSIENPQDVVVVSAKEHGQRSVFKFAQYTGSQYIAGRYTPGTFTNQIQRAFLEPRLLIVTNPITDSQPVLEASYANIPTIAFCDVDASLDHVDVAIPCNNKGKQSIALMYWFLAREVRRMHNQLRRTEKWDVMVDLFMYREPAETEKLMAAEDTEAPADDTTHFEGAAGRVTDWAATAEADTVGDSWAGSVAEPEAPGDFSNWESSA
jgi:small subunit ribosomal protein SAe